MFTHCNVVRVIKGRCCTNKSLGRQMETCGRINVYNEKQTLTAKVIE